MKYILVFCFTVCVFSNDCPIVNFNIVWQKTNLDKLRHAKVLDNNLNEAKIVTIQSNQTLDQICKETLINHVRMMSVARNGLECISNGFDFINKIGNIVLDANSWDCTCLEDLEIWYNNNDLDSTHVSNFDCK
ncbi:hypothetical protein QE152_g32156 [Popillia japonica]|uniref:Receptor L-domain domain-containing protein n=1 Tax=Popillia japonica TaxID=7064 RepID=A0AAW1IZY4_POPJA